MNKFCDECLYYSICEKEGKDDPAMVFCDDRIAEAIPIEWVLTRALNSSYFNALVLTTLVKEWRAENEERKVDQGNRRSREEA